ncbi:hypothetical protein C5C04_04830 [Rathayibacter rathayi]|uniref:Uncharacterized protein n=2 Tax=Rathayibacter rathayi TaxID=33887 RepID=A0ABD6W9U2_RATRA|nr:hypothetical protein C5C04_04830 [Rathayibacter rathayi]PPI70434.1 hypothetical protein C5E12_09205 [Rathayibacter rathayi]
MSVDALWKFYELDRRGIAVQFPLEDDFPQKRIEDKRLAKFLSRLDGRFVEAIENAQPGYTGGLLDVPSNLSAVFIRNLSNANKHRNITPVVVSTVLAVLGTTARGLQLDCLDGDKREGLPPLNFRVVYDSDQHSREDMRRYISALAGDSTSPLQIGFQQRLLIDRHEIYIKPPRFEGEKMPWRIELQELLTKVPAYVRLTLRNLNRVHQVIQEGGDKFYLLDQDATL